MIKGKSQQTLMPAYNLVNGIKKRELKAEQFDNKKIKLSCNSTQIKEKSPKQNLKVEQSPCHKEQFELSKGRCFESLSNLRMRKRSLSSTSFFILNMPQKTSKRDNIKSILDFPNVNTMKNDLLKENISMVARKVIRTNSNAVTFAKSKILSNLKQKVLNPGPAKPFFSRQGSIHSHITEDEESFRPKAKYCHIEIK
ncbi:unnamed protein product [Blepharisma stoltei]|uniref:Uncharacterized protein n=1 Tax=Blepharisma stoltei TaxID=1481888 RepID=A0AAU9JFT0_9CILI|nr:unnamed protein product [Blepharisma stoltei]